MVFGYYHINMRTHDAAEIPELNLPPGTKISQKVKVGHLLWIPFIPMGKVWTIQQNGQMYSLNRDAAKKIDDRLGPKGNPWYSFFGIIAIPCILTLMNISSSLQKKANQKRYKAQFQKTLSINENAISNPSDSDLFYFKDSKSRMLVLKMNRSTSDSLYFLTSVNNNNKKWHDAKWTSSYFYGSDNPLMEVAFSKEDLKKTYTHTLGQNMYKKGIQANNLPYMHSPIHLEKISKILNKENLPIVSKELNDEIKEAFKLYISNSGSVDSMLHHLDFESIKYLKDIHENSKKSDKEVVTFYKKNNKAYGTKGSGTNRMFSNYRSTNHCFYEFLLYSRYVYHGLESGPALVQDPSKIGKQLTDESLRNFVFFLNLLERGFLSLERKHIKEAEIVSVTTPTKLSAILRVKSPSNMLKKATTVTYSVAMNKENGVWKLNLPSTMSYTHNQILTAGGGSSIDKQWRERIRQNIKELAKGKNIDPTWDF